MALVTIPVHGQILDLDGLTPAVGTVTFRTLVELNDTVANITYPPADFVATLDGTGQFTINLPTTDNPDITPLNWVYQAFISTTTWRETIYFQLPFAPGTTEFADLERLDYDPCAGTVAGTPIPPEDEALFVRKAGDTMTGNLVINANLAVNGSASAVYQGVNGDIMRLMSSVISTGVTSGGVLSINANPALLDVSAVTGWIVDYNSSGTIGATNPDITYVSLPAQVGLALTGPPAQVTTWWLVDSAGTIIQQAANPSAAQRRTHLVLGATAQFGGVIFIVQTLPVVQSQPNNQAADLMDGLRPFSKSGNVVSANGANLTINKTVGTLFARGFSQLADYVDPHHADLAAQAPVSCRRATATAVLPALETLIDVANYDPGGLGVVTPVGGGANTATNFRVWAFGSANVTDQMNIQYGQNTYSSLANAVAGLGSGLFTPNPLFVDGALLGWISVIRTATDLSDPTQAVFTQASKFATP